MNSIFIYDFTTKSPGQKSQRTAVIFCAEPSPPFSGANDEIREYFDQAMPPDAVYVVLSDALSDDDLKLIAGEKRLYEVLPGVENGTKIHFVTFDHKGNLFLVGANETVRKKPLPTSLSECLRLEGLRVLFRRKNGILEASTTHHYAKPSGKHCNQFIRTGNVLNSSAEINFIAFCTLPFIDEEVTHLYCDTSSINSVAYAISYLRSHFDSPEINSHFVIDSFGSYEGLKKFKFQNAAKAVVLISASTSGHLLKAIMAKDRDIERNRIVTFFYLAEEDEKTDGKVLCDLRKTEQNPSGYDPIINYEDRDNCELCRKGSICVKIVGDQFLPENPNVTTHLVRAIDVPNWLNGFMRQFSRKNIIKCYYNADGPDDVVTPRKREIFLDVAPLYEDEKQLKSLEKFYPRWQKTLAQNVPSCLSRIVHLDDRASKALAELVHAHFKTVASGTTEPIEFKSAREMRKGSITPDTTGATIVVCGCMGTGRKLMSVSQSLRNVQTNGAITFLIGLSRTPYKASFDEIHSNLTYGDVPKDYGFSCVESIHCRDNALQVDTSWDTEKRFLEQLENHPEHACFHPLTQEWIKERLAVFEAANESRGLSNDVFCQTPVRKHLALRRNMAFVNFEYAPGDISQAEVYFTVSSILHHLRDSTQRGRDLKASPLVQHEHHRVLLSPQCFARFNDGVIQAAFLRAANQAELDYKIDANHSEEMLDVLTPVFENWDDDIGEACCEFLLALATDKLQLAKKDVEELLSRFSKTTPPPSPHLIFLSKQICIKLELNTNSLK